MTSDRPVALVTGGHRRVGLAISHALAARGCDLIITSHSRPAVAAGAAKDIVARHRVDVRVESVDLADGEGTASFVRTIGALPRLDVVVHNASVYGPHALQDIDGSDVQRMLAVNAIGPLLISKHAGALLSASPMPGGGAIVCMADIHATGEHSIPRSGFAPYAMSKAALVEMMRALARELAPRVRVNAVAPGVVAWPESGYESDEEAQRAYLDRVPLARAGTPEDAATAVAWLALDAHYTTGQIIRVDGGRALR